MRSLKDEYRSPCKVFFKQQRTFCQFLPLRFIVASSTDPRMKELYYTLEQGSHPIKYTGDTAHCNVLNPENAV